MNLDKYNLLYVGDVLNDCMMTEGVKLLHTAIQQFPDKVFGSTRLRRAMQSLMIPQHDTVECKRDLETIREYMRSYHEMYKDYHSPEYMDFHGYLRMYKSVARVKGITFTTSRYNNIYQLHSYFTDTIPGVLYMSPEVREGVKTLFITKNYIDKLELMKPLVTPDTLVISVQVIKTVRLDLLPSVHRISIEKLPGSKQVILLDDYVDTLTELHVSCGKDKGGVDTHLLRFMRDATQLESVFIETEDNVCKELTSMLHARRKNGMRELNVFKYRMTNLRAPGTTEILELLNELQYLPLDVLELSMTEDDNFSVTNKIAEIVGSKSELTTLSLRCISHRISDMIPLLRPVLTNIKTLILTSRLWDPTDAIPYEEIILEMPEVRYVMMDGLIRSNVISEHLEKNRMQDDTVDSVSLICTILNNE